MTERKLADELYEHRHDVGEWSKEPVIANVKPAGTAVVSFRIPSEELDAVEEAAERAGETISEYVRNAVTMRRKLDYFWVSLPTTLVFGPSQFTLRAFATHKWVCDVGWSQASELSRDPIHVGVIREGEKLVELTS